jgi:hypothetical protein
MPPSKGIPPLASLLASNTSRGISREWLEPWPCMDTSPVFPDSVTRGQLSNLGRGPAFDPSRFIVGSEPIIHSSGHVRLRIPFRLVGACLFRSRNESGAVVGGVVRWLQNERWTRALTPRVSRERLGKDIKCGNCSYLFIGSSRWSSTGV